MRSAAQDSSLTPVRSNTGRLTQKPLVRGRSRGAISEALSCAALSAAMRAAGLVSAARCRTITVWVTTATSTYARLYHASAKSADVVTELYP